MSCTPTLLLPHYDATFFQRLRLMELLLQCIGMENVYKHFEDIAPQNAKVNKNYISEPMNMLHSIIHVSVFFNPSNASFYSIKYYCVLFASTTKTIVPNDIGVKSLFLHL